MNLILWTEAREGHCLVALIPEHIWESAGNPQRPNTCPSPGDGICQFPFIVGILTLGLDTSEKCEVRFLS